MALISEDDAIKLLEEMVNTHKDNFGTSPEKIMQHFSGTKRIAREIAKKLGLSPDELAIAGLYHDTGRCFSKDKKSHTFHEIIGARYIEEHGVELEITDSQEQCDRLAQALRSHAFVSEQFVMDEYNQWLPGLRDTNPNLLLPSSWNELIVTYADLTNANGQVLDFKERLADVKNRDRENNSPRLKAVEEAESRLLTPRKRFKLCIRKRERGSNKMFYFMNFKEIKVTK